MKNYLIAIVLSTFCGILSAQNVKEWIDKGLMLDSIGNHQEAVLAFSKAIELEPSLALAWYNRGVAKINLNKISEAIVDFNKCIFLDTAIYEAYFNRAIAHRLLKNYQFAWADINKYLLKFPDDRDAVFERLELGYEMQEYQYLEKDLTHLLKADPYDRMLTIKLCEYYIEQLQFEKAIQICTKMINEDQEQWEWFYWRAFAKYRNSQFKESLEDINIYLIQHPNHEEALKLKADIFFYLNDFSSAANLYLQFLQKDSTNGVWLSDYGHCLLQQKKYAEAEAYLTKSIKYKSDSPGYALLGRGLARYNLGNMGDACLDWEKASMFGVQKAKEYLQSYCKTESR